MKKKEKKQKELTDQEINEAWDVLWELAQNQIIWGEGKIDHDGFVLLGKRQFDLKIKRTAADL